jgi:hypothetical protein
MRYVILIWSNPGSREIWESFTPEEQASGFAEYGRIVDSLVASGELIVTHALADPSLAKRIASVEDGRTLTTDGPFPEMKELLAGFFLVECASMDRAVEIAAMIPEAPLGLVEVRPVMTLDPPEL